MARKVMFSFNFADDFWRTSTVRQIGAIEGNALVSDNDWETVKRGGDQAIERWIDGQISGTSCTIVLVGAATAGRKWINYEIRKTWNEKKGLLGIRIHRLLNQQQQASIAGRNPFDDSYLNSNSLSNYVSLYDPQGATSKDVYKSIADNIENWIEAAIKARK